MPATSTRVPSPAAPAYHTVRDRRGRVKCAGAAMTADTSGSRVAAVTVGVGIGSDGRTVTDASPARIASANSSIEG